MTNQTIKLYNTGTKTLQDFKTIIPGKVSMYVCGPTVYAKPHLGNARPMIVFDVLYRLFIHNFGMQNVKYVRNITDIDDKIINKAKELNCSIYDVTSKALAEFEYIQQELNILSPTDQPKATEYIERMCVIIKDLLDKGHAYINDVGDILFKVDTFDSYHFFQDHSKSQIHRINNTDKHSDEDFVLWKNVIDEDFEKYQFAWETPSYMSKNPDVKNFGRPGWHIECTAMSTAILGDKFDLHGGGSDLISPHHQNERAQTCAYTCLDDCANYWMHNGMIQVENGKMSKSLGNVLYLDEVCSDFDPLSVRFYMLHTHYRHPLLWSHDILTQMHLKYTNIIKQIYLYAEAMKSDDCDANISDITKAKSMNNTNNHQTANQHAIKADSDCNTCINTCNNSTCSTSSCADQKSFWYILCPMYWLNLFKKPCGTAKSAANTCAITTASYAFAQSETILDALSNDLNTPLAITSILQHITKNEYDKAIAGMYMLGLLSKNIMNDIDTVSWTHISENCLAWLQRRELTDEQKDTLAKRAAYRAQKDYTNADAMRKILSEQKILVDDTATGYLWYVL